MEGDVQFKLETPNPCCASWKSKFLKLEEKRNCLRQAVKLLEQQIDRIQAEAKKVSEEERARADFERGGREKEAAARLALADEIVSLKSEILSLKQRGGSDVRDGNSEAKALHARVADGEREIRRLKEAVQSERKRADLEKKKASESPKGVEVVKLEKEMSEKYKFQVELLRKEVDGVKSNLAAETLKLNEVNKKLEVEKKRTVKETKRAEFEKVRAEEQRKLAEAFKKRLVEGKIYAESLSRQLEESKKKIDDAHDSKLVLELSVKLEEVNKKLQLEKRKASKEKERADGEMSRAESQRNIVEANRKNAMEEKSRADVLCKRSEEDKQKIAEFEKQIKELMSSRSSGSIATEELKLLRKRLKLEKMKQKHSKQEVILERSRSSILQQEVARLKLDFDQFSCRLDLLHKSFSPGSRSNDGLGKNVSIINMPRSVLNPSFTEMDTSGILRQSIHHPTHLSPLPEGNFVEPITGINSKLESLHGGSTRTMLKSPAINFSTTSFSNGQLVGSQDKGAFSVSTSALLAEECSQPTVSGLSDEATEMRSGENQAVVAENSVRGPVGNVDVDNVSMDSKKRKRILDAVETIENLYNEDKKLHLQIEEKLAVLHGIVDKQLDKGIKAGKVLPPSFLGSSGAQHDRHNKKRKTSFQQTVVLQPAGNSSAQKKIDVVQVHGGAKSCREASSSDFDMIGFEKLANGQYMNLLNLDDVSFEECYRAAMEMPLSPTLPEIECSEMQDVDTTIPLVENTLCEELSFEKEKVFPSQVFNVDIEITSNKSKSDGTAVSGSVENNWHTGHQENASVCLNHAVVQMATSNANVSGDERSQFTIEDEFGYLVDKSLEHCIVVSSTIDRSSICRIYYAIRSCIAQFSLATQTKWMIREILLAIKMEEQLLAMEKVCALFSLLMINFSVVASVEFGDYLNWASIACLNSFAGHVHSVMSDVEIRSFLAQLGCLDDLLSLIESFFLDEGFKVLRPVSFGSTVERNSRDNIRINDSSISLSFIPVSAEQLVAGSVILASICAAVDHIGFMCETSFNILRVHKLGNSLILTILHIFAYLGGDKFFSLSDYSLMMTVLKSIVRNNEGLSSSSASICYNPIAEDAQNAFRQCMKCPFVEDNGNVVSVDTVASLLLEKVKANDVVEPVCGHKMNDNGTCSLKKYDLSGNLSDTFTATKTLSSLTDLLALVELVACNMGWEWTSDKIVPHLLKLLESSVLKNSMSGIIILLGQLGRLGVLALGYEDIRVEQIRSDLTAFLRRAITMEAGLPIQIATVNALIGLLSVDFETILQTNEKLPAMVSNLESTDLIRKWFSSLKKNQQDLSLNVLQSADDKSAR